MIDSNQLASSIFISGLGVYLSSGLPFEKLSTVGLSSFEVSDKVENKIRTFTQNLTSVLSERFDVGNRKLCFRLTSVSGEQFLIGSHERPYPLVTFTDSRPDSVTSKCAVTLLVSYSNVGFYPVLAV